MYIKLCFAYISIAVLFQLMTVPTVIVTLLDLVSHAIQVSMVNSVMKLVLHHAGKTSVIAKQEGATTALLKITDRTVVLTDFMTTHVTKFALVSAYGVIC